MSGKSGKRAIIAPEDQFDMLLLGALLVLALLSMLGMFPAITGMMPKLYSGIFRAVDMVKNRITPLKYI